MNRYTQNALDHADSAISTYYMAQSYKARCVAQDALRWHLNRLADMLEDTRDEYEAFDYDPDMLIELNAVRRALGRVRRTFSN